MKRETVNVGRAILAGAVATLAMTMMVYVAPMMGMPKMDIAGLQASRVSAGYETRDGVA